MTGSRALRWFMHPAESVTKGLLWAFALLGRRYLLNRRTAGAARLHGLEVDTLSNT